MSVLPLTIQRPWALTRAKAFERPKSPVIVFPAQAGIQTVLPEESSAMPRNLRIDNSGSGVNWANSGHSVPSANALGADR